MAKFIDLTGQRFGNLTVIERAENRGKETQWKCLCDCGAIGVFQANNLRSGHTKSCGCLKKISHNKTHGKSGTRLYYIWHGMKNRCSNPTVRDYKSYGGKGVKVCEEWQDFQKFHDWAYSSGYIEDAERGKTTLDRIDLNGNYCPRNCRWITNKEQQNNRSNNIFVTYNGKKQTLSQWSEKLGIPYLTLRKRIVELGWDTERAFTQKVGNQGKRGKRKTLNSKREGLHEH